MRGESMKKGANCAKVKILSKDCIFHMAIFYWFILHFSHSFLNWLSNLRPNMMYNMIKTQMFLYQTLYYSQIYNFTLNHDYKFKIIIVLKGIWVLKFKKYICISFFWMFWAHGCLLVEYIKIHE
jgi:Zn-dependent protease